MIGKMSQDYVSRLRHVFAGRVPGGADLVTYWFEKATSSISVSDVTRAGLVATNSIRGGANRKVLDRVRGYGKILEAWSDEPWVLDGAAVRVSLICFSGNSTERDDMALLDGVSVASINSDLTCGATDLGRAEWLRENKLRAFSGISKKGKFDVPGMLARRWLNEPVNPNGKYNKDVVFPWINGIDIVDRNRDMWIIHFGEMEERQATFFEAPFRYVVNHVRPVRQKSNSESEKNTWWRLARRASLMQEAIRNLDRYIAIPEVSKHKIFIWVNVSVVPDKNVVVIAKDDDTSLGILHSRCHRLWALRLGTSLEDRPRYTSTTTFRTFPFPEGLTPNIPAAQYADDPRAVRIAEVARRLNELRENWLNPPDLVRREPEVVPGYPDRILPVSERAAQILKKRTLTNLYNERPIWLDNVHRELDDAVAAAYGWPTDLSDDEILKRLLDLNLARAASQSA